MLPIYNPNGNVLEENPAGVVPASVQQSVALVCMPWGAVSRASIALGILKQCARRIGVEADVHYLNMRFAEMLGVDLYYKISENSAFFPEWFFSCALFGPNGLGLMKNTFEDLCASDLGAIMKQGLEETGSTEATSHRIVDDIIPNFIDECLTEIDWSKYKVIGFSNLFAQTLSSLLLARKLKERHPDAVIVFGGANMDSEMGFEIIRAFDWVDYVVHGEAERTFPRLLHNVLTERPFEKIPGISMRKGADIIAGFSEAQMLKNLDESPPPDYSDYFREASRIGLQKRVHIGLPFESSRGCWWGAKSHCTFCGLNGSTMAFRKKSPSRVYDEIFDISSKYRCLTLNAVDNIMDLDYFQTLLPRLAEADLDLSIFYEVKANMTKRQVRKLAEAGITRIQPGIESFNTEILRMMRKGVTGIQNIQLLKWCFEYGIDSAWNMLYGFPGENADQYKDCPRIFRLLFHLRPPTAVASIKFERFSPYHFEKEKFKLTLKPLSLYRMIYPEHLIDYEKVAYYFEGEWEGQQDVASYIKPTMDTFREWVDIWKQKTIFFYYEKGPQFLTLYDSRPLKPADEITIRKRNLNEFQSKLYLFCDEIRSFNAIQAMLDSCGEPAGEEKIRAVLEQFVDHGLIYREGDRYLSLAVRKSAKKPDRFSNGFAAAEH